MASHDASDASVPEDIRLGHAIVHGRPGSTVSLDRASISTGSASIASTSSDSTGIASTDATSLEHNNSSVNIPASTTTALDNAPTFEPPISPAVFALAADSTPKRVSSSFPSSMTHRRYQSHGHISFPTLTMPSTSAFTAPHPPPPSTSMGDVYHVNPMTSVAERVSVSVPSTPGPGHGVAPRTGAGGANLGMGGHGGGLPPVGSAAEKETYTLSDRTSTLMQTSGQVPPTLIGSTSVIHGNKMFLFGGRPPGADPTNNLYVLNLDTLVWRLLDQHQQQQRKQESQQEQQPQQEQQLQTENEGQPLQASKEHDLATTYNLQHSPSMQVQQSTEETFSESRTNDGPSLIPRPRYYHSAVLVTAPPLVDTNGTLTGWGGEHTAHMFIFGGRGLDLRDDGLRSEVCLNDTHILDLDNLCWIPSSLAGQGSELAAPMTTEDKSRTSRGSESQPLQQHQRQDKEDAIKSAFATTIADNDSVPEKLAEAEQSPDPVLAGSEWQKAHDNTSYNHEHRKEHDWHSSMQSSLPTVQGGHDPYQYHTPEYRFAHLASMTGDHMAIFGGRGLVKEPIQDISVLDLRTHLWMKGGTYQGQAHLSQSSLASVEEPPMARRRRRYLECLTVERRSSMSSASSLRPPRPSSIASTSSLSACNTQLFPPLTTVSSRSSSSDYNGPTAPLSGVSPAAMITPLLNPRKNSWHRGEGHPFDPSLLSFEYRHRVRSESAVAPPISEDGIQQEEQQQQQPESELETEPEQEPEPEPEPEPELEPMPEEEDLDDDLDDSDYDLDLDFDLEPRRRPQRQQTMKVSSKAASLLGLNVNASLGPKPIDVFEATKRARQPSNASTATSRSSHFVEVTIGSGSSIKSSKSAGSVASRSRSQSNAASSLKSTSSSFSGKNAPKTPAVPLTHAVPKKFFGKGNSSSTFFDLDSLATIVARDQRIMSTPPSLNQTSTGLRDTPSLKSVSRSEKGSLGTRRNSNSNSVSSTSSYKSGAMTDETTRGGPRRSHADFDGEDKSDKRRSMDSGLDSVSISEAASTADDKSFDYLRPALHTPVSQPLYMFTNYVATDNKLKRDFIKIQPANTPYHSDTGKVSYNIRPEWTPFDLRSGILGGPEGPVPPKMVFPTAQIVDHCFLLSGVSLSDDTATTASSVPGANAVPPTPSLHHHHQQQQRQPATESAGPNSVFGRRTSFSVWMHHFHNHQWIQLELSKNLRAGEWRRTVLDFKGNFLYIFGKRTGEQQNQRRVETGGESASAGSVFMDWTDSELDLESPLSGASFTHMIKVDLEGLEICPAVDESSVGPLGVKLGLEMLRDGIGADVILVSSADGGRVRVNSAIVGQRWGYFQALIKERDRIRDLEAAERATKKESSDEGSGTDDDDEYGRTPTATMPQRKKRTPAEASKQWYLNDQPSEILVRESTPILVAFLQYIYTNDLTTSHQLRLKTLQGLLLVSHFYDLTRLQQLVRRALYQQLNASNAHAICEVAVLTHEFGLQTRALRTLLSSARMALLRREGERAEAKRREDFEKSRLEEVREDMKRKASMHASQLFHWQQSQGLAASGGMNMGSGSMSSALRATASVGNSMLLAGSLTSPMGISGTTAPVASGAAANSSSTTGLGTLGRFFRHREESAESLGPMF